jgi:hypothetical protein
MNKGCNLSNLRPTQPKVNQDSKQYKVENSQAWIELGLRLLLLISTRVLVSPPTPTQTVTYIIYLILGVSYYLSGD